MSIAVICCAALLSALSQSTQLTELVERLGHDELSIREAAAADLEKLGPTKLAELRLLHPKTSDASIREQLARIIARIEINNEGLPRIAFTRGKELAGEIYLWEKGKETRLTKNDAMETNVSWSPDGTQLLFWSIGNLNSNETDKVVVLDVTAGKESVLAKGRVPAWSPGGREIAYFQEKEFHCIGRDGLNGRKLGDFPGIVNDPAYWSSDGRHITFECEKVVYALEVKTGETRKIAAFPTGIFVLSTFTTSADRSLIAMVAGNGDLYRVGADGADLRKLTRDIFECGVASCSPTGSRIALVYRDGGTKALDVLSADGKERTRLADDADAEILPQWSPDEKWLVYASKDGDLCVVHSRGLARRKLVRFNAPFGFDAGSGPAAFWKR